MVKEILTVNDDFDNPEDQGRGIYDPEPADDEDLWFLPDEGVAADDLMPPLPRADRQALYDATDWQAAQDGLSGPLAELAVTFGALDERLRSGPEGWRQRLALLEVVDLGWWTGDRIGAERLALWVGLRLAATGEDTQALARAGWAVRRLSAGPLPGAGGWIAGAGAFLGRSLPEADDVPDALADLAEVMEASIALHPVTQAAIVFHGWRMLTSDTAHQRLTTETEAAVMAARHAAGMGRGQGAMFVPLALSGHDGLRATGSVANRLAAWIRGADRATLAALLHLDRVRDWGGRASAALSDRTGRTPPALVQVFADWPMVSAPLAEQVTGASRAAVQRNLDLMQDRGLIREITGQGRYRVWTAQI